MAAVNEPIVICLGHSKHVGKDTVGDYLVGMHGFHRVSFAEPLKRSAMMLFGLTEQEVFVDKDIKLERFEGKTPRYFLIRLGKAIRDGFSPHLFVQLARSTIEEKLKQGRDVVVTDLRLSNEWHTLKGIDGHVHMWRLQRKSAPKSNEQTEIELQDDQWWDKTIVNNGTIDELFAAVESNL